MFGAVQSFITPIFDYFERIESKVRIEILSFLGCLFCALLGIIFTLNSGYYWVNVFNDYSVGVPLIISFWGGSKNTSYRSVNPYGFAYFVVSF